MAATAFCYLYLTCSDGQEATKIAGGLLDKHLIICAKQLPVTSAFRWQGKILGGKEILLIMESRLDLFDEVEKALNTLHSYDTFVLEAVPISKVSKDATKWINDNLK
ncbi:divalent-cation tolerance protein CutA [Candidatus Saccharibacteria bacterium]|nr:divalent-cation tolerance protein CutA [Candidatus Saccharibacteria bacterium]